MLEFSVQVLEHVLVTFSCVHDFLKRTQGPQVSKPYSAVQKEHVSPPKLHILLKPSSVSLRVQSDVPKLPSKFTEGPV